MVSALTRWKKGRKTNSLPDFFENRVSNGRIFASGTYNRDETRKIRAAVRKNAPGHRRCICCLRIRLSKTRRYERRSLGAGRTPACRKTL